MFHQAPRQDYTRAPFMTSMETQVATVSTDEGVNLLLDLHGSFHNISGHIFSPSLFTHAKSGTE